jgi:hypothetical protein
MLPWNYGPWTLQLAGHPSRLACNSAIIPHFLLPHLVSPLTRPVLRRQRQQEDERSGWLESATLAPTRGDHSH